MKKLRISGAALSLLALLLSPPAVTAQADPAALFGQFVEARNRGDVAAAVALFADDVIYRGGGCTPCVGTVEMRDEIERRVAQGQQTAVVRAESRTDVNGEVALLRIEFTTDEQRNAGRAPNAAVASVWARGGRISFVSIVSAAHVAAVMAP